LIFYLSQPVDWHPPNRTGFLRPNNFPLNFSQSICVTIIVSQIGNGQ
jgi:hypothetical protein